MEVSQVKCKSKSNIIGKSVAITSAQTMKKCKFVLRLPLHKKAV